MIEFWNKEPFEIDALRAEIRENTDDFLVSLVFFLSSSSVSSADDDLYSTTRWLLSKHQIWEEVVPEKLAACSVHPGLLLHFVDGAGDDYVHEVKVLLERKRRKYEKSKLARSGYKSSISDNAAKFRVLRQLAKFGEDNGFVVIDGVTYFRSEADQKRIKPGGLKLIK